MSNGKQHNQETPAKQHHSEDGKRDITGKIHVRGEIEANLPPAFIEEYKSSNEKSDARENSAQARDRKRFGLEIITLVIVTFYASLTFWQGCSSKKMAQYAGIQIRLALLDQRPYVKDTKLVFYDFVTKNEISEPEIGKPILVTIAFTNSGKSAALGYYGVRFVRFGQGAEQILSLNPHFIHPARSTMMPGELASTSAITRRDDLHVQSAMVSQQNLVDWDGSQPIILLAYFFYEDAFGGSYCTRIANQYIGHGSWLELSDSPPGIPCEDKPPKGD